MIETFKLCMHLTRRNWMVYRKDFFANVSPTLADPAFFILSFGLGLGAYVSQIEGHTYLEFMAPGLAVSTALMTSFFETSYGFYVQMRFENVFKAMLTTPIGVREIIIGEFIWVALKGAAMAFGVSMVLAAFGLMKNPSLLPLTIIVGVLVALPSGAMGLLATSYVRNINQFQLVYSFLIAPLFFLSGIFFPLWQMPMALQIVAKCLPISHGVILQQSIFWDKDIGPAFVTSGSILILQSAILGGWAYYRMQKMLKN